MAGVKTLADARSKLTILTAVPTNLKAIPLATLTSGLEGSCAVAKNGTRFSATASDTISDPAWCDDTNASVFGPSNAEGSIVPFWLLDAETGAYASADNPVYEAAREKGTVLAYVIRTGPKKDQPWAAGDKYDVYIGMSDNPQAPSEASGYIKRSIPLTIQAFALDCTVAAS